MAAKVKVGDSVNVVSDGKAVKGKVTAVGVDGQLDVTLPDGKVLTHLGHASSGQANTWHSSSTNETLSGTQSDPAVIEIGKDKDKEK